MSEFLTSRISVGSAFCLAAVSCAPEPADSVSRDQTIEYAVGLTASELSRLPRCTTALNGTVAHIDSPSSLWTCGFGRWNEIPCTISSSGDVAYSSTEPALWACVKRTWTPIAVPGGAGPAGPTGPTGATGPTGPTGPTGAAGHSSLVRVEPEPAGSHCAEGGVRVETGIDDNTNQILDAIEIDDTAYVCNGITPVICGDSVVGPGEQCDRGPVASAECNSDCTTPACGNNRLESLSGEECDDGNVVSGDGCSLICRVEPVSCAPGNVQCLGNALQTCGSDGTFGPAVPCTGLQQCLFGVCLDS
ncbi:MAG TPA: hypothetical protein VFG30_24110 [Polyangiales bacterium]|nr:hypothetical protein [Polyangiales bacterium]